MWISKNELNLTSYSAIAIMGISVMHIIKSNVFFAWQVERVRYVFEVTCSCAKPHWSVNQKIGFAGL